MRRIPLALMFIGIAHAEAATIRIPDKPDPIMVILGLALIAGIAGLYWWITWRTKKYDKEWDDRFKPKQPPPKP